MPVQSLVCNPPQNSIVGGKSATNVTVKGVAWSGGGRKVERVDVSIDGGKTWTAAELYKPIEQRRNHHWAWTQFHQIITLPEEMQTKLRKGQQVQLDIVSKAMNSDFNVQPEAMEPYWNARGVCINHWYHVKSTMDPNKKKSYLRHDPENQQFGNTMDSMTTQRTSKSRRVEILITWNMVEVLARSISRILTTTMMMTSKLHGYVMKQRSFLFAIHFTLSSYSFLRIRSGNPVNHVFAIPKG
jgi:hypothetical protein